jgi:hypothetical protein
MAITPPKMTSVMTKNAAVIARARNTPPAMVLVAVAPAQAMESGGRGHQTGRDGGEQQRQEIGVLLHVGNAAEKRAEGCCQQESKQHLDAGQHHAKFVEKLYPLLVKFFFVPLLARSPLFPSPPRSRLPNVTRCSGSLSNCGCDAVWAKTEARFPHERTFSRG